MSLPPVPKATRSAKIKTAAEQEWEYPVYTEDELKAYARQAQREAVAAAVPETNFGNMADPFTYIIQHLNSNPYSLTKDECVSLVKELRDKYLAAAPGGER